MMLPPLWLGAGSLRKLRSGVEAFWAKFGERNP